MDKRIALLEYYDKLIGKETKEYKESTQRLTNAFELLDEYPGDTIFAEAKHEAQIEVAVCEAKLGLMYDFIDLLEMME